MKFKYSFIYSEIKINKIWREFYLIDIKNYFKDAKIYDISVSLSSKMPVFPGQPKFKREFISKISNGKNSNVSKITMTSHTGTHVDSPYHFIQGGDKIGEINFSSIIGFTKVFEIHSSKVGIEEIKDLEIVKGDIILFKTSNSNLWGMENFSYDYVYITPEAATYLAQREVHAVGIDYIILEALADPKRPVHHILLGQNIILIEGLNFSNVPAGEYLLVCLPLKISGNEAAPARAILIKNK